MSELVASLISYLDASPTPYHAAAESARILRDAGFVALEEAERWKLEPGLRAYVIRGGTSLIAFICGDSPASDAGFLAIGAHTDSPNLRIKPSPDLQRYGYRQLGVEVYGGVLLSTWLDRDLSLAGRVNISHQADVSRPVLVDVARPLLRIPNLAIHLNRNVNSDGLVLNAQSHLAPVFGLSRDEPESLRELLAAELVTGGVQVQPEDIVSWDLSLYDRQGAAVSGANSEFLHSARLDNLASCYAATLALAGAPRAHAATRVIALYDHEEVGSRSAQGASSPYLRQVLERISQAGGQPSAENFTRAIARSFLISADMAHGIHPNYADRHEANHAPVLGGGPVIKTNVSQAYATDSEGAARFTRLCRDVEVPVQQFVVRSDLPCGSTIGPITAGQLGLRTVDVGNPMLSMHSIREMASTADASMLARVFDRFFA